MVKRCATTRGIWPGWEEEKITGSTRRGVISLIVIGSITSLRQIYTPKTSLQLLASDCTRSLAVKLTCCTSHKYDHIATISFALILLPLPYLEHRLHTTSTDPAYFHPQHHPGLPHSPGYYDFQTILSHPQLLS